MLRGLSALLLLSLSTAVAAQDHAADGQAAPPPPSYDGNRCVGCHQGLSGRLQEVTVEWRTSTHFQRGIACEGCHGGDPQAETSAHDPSTGFVGTPRLRDVPYRCGKCHEAIKEKHLGSPHGAQGLPHCVSCHGSHTVTTPVPADIIREDACSKCHDFKPAASALEALGDARRTVDELHRTVKEIEHIPQVERQLQEFQHSMALDRAGIVTTFHSFRIGDIERIGMNARRLEKKLVQLAEREEGRRTAVAQEVPFIVGLMLFLLASACFGYLRYHGIGKVEPGK